MTYYQIEAINRVIEAVAKVDELMTLCGQLKTRLHENQTTKLQLADTIVKQAPNRKTKEQ